MYTLMFYHLYKSDDHCIRESSSQINFPPVIILPPHLDLLLHLRDQHLVARQRRLDGIPRLEDGSQLLERASRRLHKQKPDHRQLQHIPEDKQQVVPPAGAGEGDARHKRIVEVGHVDEEIVHPHAFGARLVPQTLDGVHGLVGRPAGREHEAKDEDHGDLRARHDGALGDDDDAAGLVVGRVDVGGVQRRDDAEEEDHQRRGGEELRAPSDPVGQERAEDGADELADVLQALQEEPGGVGGDAGAGQHLWVVVGDGAVAGPLSEEGLPIVSIVPFV
jgi:hypothetical protein